MSIEGEFVRFTSRARKQLAFVTDSIDAGYLDDIHRFEVLEKDHEYELAKRWREHGDRDADYILRSWSLVKIGTTANQKKLFFKLGSAKHKISVLEGGDLHPDQVTLIAKRLNVTERDVVDMNRRLFGDTSINAPIHEEGQPDEWQNYLVDQSPSPEAIVAERDEKDYQNKALASALGVLNDRERRIFEARHLTDEPPTLEDLAAEFNLSPDRISQIETCAFEKVRKAAKKRAAEHKRQRRCALAAWNCA
jgi:RNA polymerase sigma-32 factor